MTDRVVILGGGVVGRWAAEHLTGGGDTVVTVDVTGPADLRADVTAPDEPLRALVADADTIVLALPEDVALACASWLPPDARLVSTCSVQEPLFAVVPAGLTGVNPMFSPTLPSAGRPVALVSREPDATSARLRQRLAAHTMVVTELTPAAHDQAMSYLQALPHAALLAYADALALAPIDPATLARLAPPPARTMMALAARILTAPPEIYWDVQRANATAADRRAELRAALDRLDATVGAGDDAEFRTTLAGVADGFGDTLETGADDCRRLFTQLSNL